MRNLRNIFPGNKRPQIRSPRHLYIQPRGHLSSRHYYLSDLSLDVSALPDLVRLPVTPRDDVTANPRPLGAPELRAASLGSVASDDR